jgi:hypothetical protein
MGSKSVADVMVRFRKGYLVPGVTAEKCKVTARYLVHLGNGKVLPCVRVHVFHGAGICLHFSEKEFNKLFTSIK